MHIIIARAFFLPKIFKLQEVENSILTSSGCGLSRTECWLKCRWVSVASRGKVATSFY